MSSRSVILWAEDDDNDALLMQRAFRKAAVPSVFIRVADGVQATKYLAGEDAYSDRAQYPFPQLLLLDIKMPRMTGLEVLEWKQSRPELKGLTAVMLSSSKNDNDMNEARRLGAKGYLVKPSTAEGLVQQVKTLQAEWLSP